MSAFSNPEAVAHYTANAERIVPGFRHLQRMTELLLAEMAPMDANILVVGAGGGLELRVFAESHSDWHFYGIDPSPEMLDLARQTLGSHLERVTLYEGYTSTAAPGPFDGACCLLTLHFLPREERLQTLVEIRKRLKPGAPLIVAHHSFPAAEDNQQTWLHRYASFAISQGVPEDNAKGAIAAIRERLPILSPEEDEQLLRDAGFINVSLFYAAFTFRGWIAYAAKN